jgi:putative endonuclease
LVYYEEFEDLSDAFVREKQIKNWHKDWKWNLEKKVNPDLQDLNTRLK